VPPSGAIASIITDPQRRIGCEIATGSGTVVVDRTVNALPDITGERDAARRRIVGATHAHQRCRHRHGHFWRHTGQSGVLQVGAVKIDTKRGATSATGKASGIGHRVLNKEEFEGIFLPKHAFRNRIAPHKLTCVRNKACPDSRYLRSKGVSGTSGTNGMQAAHFPASRCTAKQNSST